METNSVLAFIIVLTSIFYLSMSTDIVCEYKEITVWPTIVKYGCDVKNNVNISSPELANISSATGTHKNGKTNMHVDIVSKSDATGFDYFPQGLDKIYPNLKTIFLTKSKIKEIRSSDLKSYWKLTYLHIGQSAIEVIEDGTFEHNSELEHLFFNGDRIIHVGLNVFNNLIKLITLSFMENICLNEFVYSKNTGDIKKLVKKSRVYCQNFEFLSLDGKIKSMESDCKHLNHENLISFEQNLESLEFEIQNSKFSYISSFKERIQELKNQKSEFKLSLNGNFENVRRIDGIQIIDDKLKINVYERFEKIEKDLETSHMYILKAVDIKMKEFETRLMDKLQEVLLQNVGIILKAMEDGDGHHAQVISSKKST